MRRLGYTRFVAQGGDWGAIITDVMAVQAPRNCSARTPTWPAWSRPMSPLRSHRTSWGRRPAAVGSVR